MDYQHPAVPVVQLVKYCIPSDSKKSTVPVVWFNLGAEFRCYKLRLSISAGQLIGIIAVIPAWLSSLPWFFIRITELRARETARCP
jgi:hypothetical protein